MAQPPAYTRKQNFTDWQTAHPGSVAQGSDLDAEFNALKTTTDAVRANLALIQRDDGKLANGSVHANAFDATAALLIAGGWTPKGSWLTATAYAIGDVVENSGTYVCTVAHTSGVFATDNAAGDWLKISAGSTASEITNVPAGNVVATDVQAAITELDAKITQRSVSLLQYATGDGVTDDTAAIDSAIAAVGAGGLLYAPAGTYLTTGNSIGKSMTLMSAPGTTFKLADAQATNTKLLTIAHDDVNILGGKWDGNKANQGVATGQNAIYHAGRTNVHVEVGSITGTTGDGFYATDSTDCSFRARNGVTLTVGSGVNWAYVSGNITRCRTWATTVDRSDAAGNTGVCINYTKSGSATGKIIGCKVDHCNTIMHAAPTGAGIVGVQMWGAGYGNEVIGGENEGGTTGVSLANGLTKSSVVGTQCFDFDSIGIELVDAQFCSAIGNTVDGNGESTNRGMSIDGSNVAAIGNEVSGNTITGVTDTGIYVYAGAHGCAGSGVTGNTIRVSAAGAHGIYDNAASDVSITGNNVDGATTAAVGIIVDGASRVPLSGNKITNFAAQSFQCLAQGVAVDEVTVTGDGWHSAQGFQFLASGGGTFGTKCQITGIDNLPWGTADHVDVIKVASDASYYIGHAIGTGTPEGNINLGPTSTYTQTDGVPGAQMWIKESGTSTTGWRQLDNETITPTTTVAYSDVAAAASKTIISAITSARFEILDIFLSGDGTSFNAGGDRNLAIQDSDGTTIYTVIPAATLKSLAASKWGFSTAVPFPTTAANLFAASKAGLAIVAKYSGGATDYTSGSLKLRIRYRRVA